VFNLEMAATDEMLGIALAVRPDFCTLVPEKRAERTTEGGLDVRAGGGGALERVIGKLREGGIGVSLFIDPDPQVVARAQELGAGTVELHTGDYCLAVGRAPRGPEVARELARLTVAAQAAGELGLRLGAGHGLDHVTVVPVAGLPHLEELNIGHGLVSRAVLIGLERAVVELRASIAAGAAHPVAPAVVA
jgi:pyridoxine 5-phosphate synthase